MAIEKGYFLSDRKAFLANSLRGTLARLKHQHNYIFWAISLPPNDLSCLPQEWLRILEQEYHLVYALPTNEDMYTYYLSFPTKTKELLHELSQAQTLVEN